MSPTLIQWTVHCMGALSIVSADSAQDDARPSPNSLHPPLFFGFETKPSRDIEQSVDGENTTRRATDRQNEFCRAGQALTRRRRRTDHCLLRSCAQAMPHLEPLTTPTSKNYENRKTNGAINSTSCLRFPPSTHHLSTFFSFRKKQRKLAHSGS